MQTITIDNEEYFDRSHLAALLEVTERTLYRWSATSYGPPFIKVGKKVLYSKASLTSWLRDNESNDRTEGYI